MPQQNVSDRWISHQRKNHKPPQIWCCVHCSDKKPFSTEPDLIAHATSSHANIIPTEQEHLRQWQQNYASQSLQQRRPSAKDESQRKPSMNDATRAQPEPPPNASGHVKRPLSHPTPARSLSGIQALNLGSPRNSEDAAMDEAATPDDGPRKRAALGDGISASGSSQQAPDSRENSQSPPPSRRNKNHPTSAPFNTSSAEMQLRKQTTSPLRPHVPSKKLWNPDQDSPVVKGSFDPSNVASTHAQKSRAPGLQSKTRKPHQPQGYNMSPRQSPIAQPSVILGSNKSIQTPLQPTPTTSSAEQYDIMLELETRPISQEQLVAEVKGIYAGLVMVEAKCIEVDNKQATLAQQEGVHSKLNNEQWQALIALHRTLLHEHHDFFLASQHPSASPALRRLASKYAMPARMWRHGIHSFLELLRHRLPASLDHMLAFIYLAYSMMALLYETVPAFEDTWIECLGDLGRYRMAIEDDDIKDREVWTGVARHWYSKASDKAPTTGRLYHHLAILARPNALQQLFYYAKSLCVPVPFTSARESILTLFEPVLNTESHTQFRLPPLDTAFVKAHGLLFTNREIERFDPTIDEFLMLLDNHINKVTRKFMEQGYQIAIANIVSMLGFASKDNVIIKAMFPSSVAGDITMEETLATSSPELLTFEKAERLHNSTLEIVLDRINDANILPFIHVTLVFLLRISQHPEAMRLIEEKFPWGALARLLNALLASYGTLDRIESDEFPMPEKDDKRPFPEDYAIRGLLWAENYFPDDWFTNEKIDGEEKYHERASMTTYRKERILFVACQVAKSGQWIRYHSQEGFTVSLELFSGGPQCEPLVTSSRSLTFGSATTTSGLDRSDTWTSHDLGPESEIEEDAQSSTMSPEAPPMP
ncbi:putative telomerase-binding protein est1a protein [Coleophoma cylindrospora]|uniref:Nonsense-mediated mRNA decay factor n=1 Tax=Coleophoma cylindrospora TaxID=1849047 RepID=A0A3D8QKB4_9HELO|nr:putative telomerase-binding protein est1a protein [Coleophoma cylindrospora]